MCTEATLTGMHDDDNDDDHDDAQGNQETDMDCPAAVERRLCPAALILLSNPTSCVSC